MKSKILMIIVFLVGILFNSYSQRRIDISNGWRFQTGDDQNFAIPEFNDELWKGIRVGSNWESEGYKNYDGIGWYRMKLIIPSSFRDDNKEFLTSGLKLSIGRIDDNDITYFNGVVIGKTEGWNLERAYTIPFNLIRWDKENVISIRIEDVITLGGMFVGPYSIEKLDKLTNLINIQSDNLLERNIPSPDSILKKRIVFKIGSAFEKLPAQIRIKVLDTNTKEVVLDKTQNIIIGSRADSTLEYIFKIKSAGSYRAHYYLFSKYTTDTVEANALLTYKDKVYPTPFTVLPLINSAIQGKATAFDLSKIQLNGYLGERLNANLNQRLLNIDEKGILECYYNRPGVQTWVGEYAGKYLHAASRVWKNSGDAQLKSQMDRIADILMTSQLANGYMGTYLPKDYWTAWDVWAHKYDMLGLLSYYSVTGYSQALETSIKIGDLLCRTFGNLPGQIKIEETGDHAGMASCSVLEPMTELYRFTGNRKYLDFCNYIIESYDHTNGAKIISSLNTIGKVTKVGNGKAYEMTSNFTGITKLYQLTGDSKLLSAMDNAWNDIVTYRTYITGTYSKGEFFQDDYVLPAENSDHMGEGCVSTSWLQFNQALYNLTGEAKYIDELERTIYNHLLAAENPLTGCVSYYTALQGKKPYRCTIMGHCCLASIPRGIAAIPELAFTKNVTNGFNVNLYTSGNFSDNIKTKDNTSIPVKLILNSEFPEKGQAVLNILPAKRAIFNIALRVPLWCKDFVANVDGEKYKGTSGQYLNIERNWGKDTKIQVSFDLNVHFIDGGKSYPGYVAIKSGAQILALDQALNPEIQDLDKVEIDNSAIVSLPKSELPGKWFGNQVYCLNATYDNKPLVIKLVPFAEAGQTEGDVRVWIKKK